MGENDWWQNKHYDKCEEVYDFPIFFCTFEEQNEFVMKKTTIYRQQKDENLFEEELTIDALSAAFLSGLSIYITVGSFISAST